MDSDHPNRITPVILSGGSGTRLWPLSRSGRPKQLLALAGPGSMLARTAQRVEDRTLYRPPIVVAAAAQAAAVEAEVAELGQLILEPCPRNTAAAIALAALNAGPGDLLLVLPSDQLIQDTAGFARAVARGVPAACDGWIVTFGMKPSRAETGYGYIKRGAALSDGVWQVERFVEKPDASRAAAYLADGGYDWNGGIFLLRAETLIEGLDRHAPEILAAARRAVDAQRRDGLRTSPDADAFAAAPAISIDHGLMEKAERVAVVPAEIGWSDVGSWESLYDVSPQDDAANVVTGTVLSIDCSGSLIRSEGPLVAAVGVQDLVVVATSDAVVIVPRSQSQRVKEIVDRLKADGKGRLA